MESVDYLEEEGMPATGAQLSSVSQLQDTARLLEQPRTTSRASEVQAPKRIILSEQQLTSSLGRDIFPPLSLPVVSASLTVLDLSFNQLDDDFWEHWTTDIRETAWPALTKLNLANNLFTARGLEAIAAFIKRCTSLTELDLSLNALCDQTSSSNCIHSLIQVLDHQDRKRLQVLDMSCTGFTDSAISQLAQANFAKYITKLYLRSNALTDEAAITLGNVLPRMKLEVLSLAGNTIGDCGATSLAFVLDQTPALHTLDLETNQIEQAGISSFLHAINGLSAPFPLRYLHLGGKYDTALEHLHTKLHEKIIETQLTFGESNASILNFNGAKVKRDVLLKCSLTDRYVHIVTQTLRTSPNWQHLEQLDLSGNEIGERGAYDVGLFLALQPPLKALNLSNNVITDKAIVGLSEGLEWNAKLQELQLDHNQITDNGAKQLYLKAFKANQQRRINLSVGNPLTPECRTMLAAISQAYDLRKRFINEYADLEKIDISGRALRQYGASAVVEELTATTTSKCRSLDLSKNGLGDEGAHAAAILLRTYPRLEELDLSFNDIGNEGAFELADALAGNSTLLSFSLHSVVDGSQLKPKLQEKGLCKLAHALQNHKTLQKLDLRNNSTSPTVIRAYVDMLQANQRIQKFNGTSSAVFLSRYETS